MISIWLIRHGESEANAGLPTSDVALIELTKKGHQEAQKVASAFTQVPSLIVIALRANQKSKVKSQKLTIHSFQDS